MTQAQEKKFERGNLLGITKFPTTDGSAKAIGSTRRIKVNTEVKVTETRSGNGSFISFRTNIYGDSSIRDLKYSLNGALLKEDNRYGVGVRVSIYARTEGQKQYLLNNLAKGATIDGLHGTFTIDPTYGVQFSVNSTEVGFIHRSENTGAEIEDVDSVPFAEEMPAEDAGEFQI